MFLFCSKYFHPAIAGIFLRPLATRAVIARRKVGERKGPAASENDCLSAGTRQGALGFNRMDVQEYLSDLRRL
jgi:hypothetical protein